MDVPLEDHRAGDFPSFVLPLLEDLKKIFQTRDGHVFIFAASGTGGWEAAITNTLSPGDKVLQARFGQFSHLWAELCRRLGHSIATPRSSRPTAPTPSRWCW
jgi:alanine-glyoxylate transaminase/serine-glyoxylate transaminase/serine-pyruvate transaminase